MQAAEKTEDLNRMFQETLQHRKGEEGNEPVESDDITKTAQAIMEQWAPEQRLKPKKPYMSEETWKLIQYRDEEMKQGNTHEASGLNKQIQQMARLDREKWLLEKSRQQRTSEMHGSA